MTCPICGKSRADMAPEDAQKYRPFCSRRCADVDLGRWLTGGYAVPSAAESDPDELAQALDEAERQQPKH